MRPHQSEEQKKKLNITDPKGEIYSFPFSQWRQPDNICGATSNLGGRPNYLDSHLRHAKPKFPSVTAN
jgi:hypothetical protein